MAMGIFKKTKAETKEKPAKKEVKKDVAVKEEAQTAPVQVATAQLVRPHITEKATALAEQNQYVFVVKSTATKKEIERDVAKKYGVDVLTARIVNIKPKRMRLGRTVGIKKGYKKAIVQIKEGQKIEVLPT